MAWGVCLTAVGCDDAAPEAAPSLVEQAEAAASRALADYTDCVSERDAGCDGEEAALLDAMERLAVARGDDAVMFRASVSADCTGGGSVSGSGHKCWATDNVGCACLDEIGRNLVSVAACPKGIE